MELRVFEAHELGRDGYPPQWHESIKHDVREQAGQRCVRCGHPYEAGAGEWSPCDERCRHCGPVRVLASEGGHVEVVVAEDDEVAAMVRDGSPVDAQWRILTVHHLDGNKANCRWWNLAALCQRCHLQIQGKVVMDRIWPWEHTAWFRPYVAGYYAWVYLGEDLPRGETEARIDELLALERAA